MDQRSDIVFSGGAKVKGIPAAAAAGEAVEYSQLNALIQGLAWKDNARAASTVNVTVASPGAAIDGVTLAANDRVLLKNQTTGAENGIYVWNGAAVPMTRAIDADAASELLSAVVTVDEGTTNAGTTWRQTVTNITLGTTTLTWSTFGTAAPTATTAVAGIVRLATQSEVNTGTDATIAVTPATLASWSGKPLRFSGTFGDGSATQYTITHNLNTLDVEVQVKKVSTGAVIGCDITATGVNTVQLNFASAPASNELRATVLA